MTAGDMIRVWDRGDAGRIVSVVNELVIAEFEDGKRTYQTWEVLRTYEAHNGVGMRLPRWRMHGDEE